MSPRIVVSAIALLVLVGVGCGGDSSSSTRTVNVAGGVPLSKDEFVARADAICAAKRGRQQSLKAEIESSSGPGATDDEVARVAELFQQASQESSDEIDRLRELMPPAADSEIISEMLATAESQVALTESYAEALAAGETTAATSLVARINAQGARAKGIAQGYGFEVCGAEI